MDNEIERCTPWEKVPDRMCTTVAEKAMRARIKWEVAVAM
jgi:hypothetical protein